MAGRPFIQLDKEIFTRMYNDNVTLVAIARYFGVSTHKVRKTRDSLGLSKRLNKVTVDENEFRRLFSQGIIYPEMAQILGMSRCSVIAICKQLNLPARHNWRSKETDT